MDTDSKKRFVEGVQIKKSRIFRPVDRGCGMRGLSAEQVERIRSEYDGQTATINRLQAEFRVERWRILAVAHALGLSRSGLRRRWTAEERDYFQEKFGEVPDEQLTRRLKRSTTALYVKAKRLGISRTYNAGHYTARLLAEMLGIDSHKITNQWLPRGLQAHRCAANRLIWHVTVDDLKEFLKQWPEAYDYRSADEDARMALEFDELPDPPAEKLVECTSMRWPGPVDNQERNRRIRAEYRRGCAEALAREYGLTATRIIQISNDRTSGREWRPCGENPVRFWAPLYESYPRCPRCGRRTSMYALERRLIRKLGLNTEK